MVMVFLRLWSTRSTRADRPFSAQVAGVSARAFGLLGERVERLAVYEGAERVREETSLEVEGAKGSTLCIEWFPALEALDEPRCAADQPRNRRFLREAHRSHQLIDVRVDPDRDRRFEAAFGDLDAERHTRRRLMAQHLVVGRV